MRSPAECEWNVRLKDMEEDEEKEDEKDEMEEDEILNLAAKEIENRNW